MINKFSKFFTFFIINITWYIHPETCTRIYQKFLKGRGANITGDVNYLSAKIWFDGSDYSKISLGKGVTISSNVRVLTHDWALHTVGNALNLKTDEPLGISKGVFIDDYVFVGTGSILMPGCHIGKGTIIGAGTVVRGIIPEFSIVIGNPCAIVGRSDDYYKKKTQFK